MQVLSVTVKDLKILLKDRGTLITLFLSPLMFIIVMSLALGQSFGSLGHGNAIAVLLVNDDPRGALANRLVTQLDAAATDSHLQFIRTAPSGARLDDRTAQQLVKDGKRAMAVLIPAGFSRRIERNQRVAVRFLVDPGAAQQAVKPVQGMLQAMLAQVSTPVTIARAVSTALGNGVPPRLAGRIDGQIAAALDGSAHHNGASLALVTPAGIRAPKYPTVYQQNVPGYTIMYVFFIVTAMAGSILQERRDGTFRRLLTTPVSKPALLLGKMLPFYIVTLLQVVILFGVGVLVFKMDLGSHPLGLAVITLALSACAVSLGLLIAAFAKSEGHVNGLTSVIVLVLAALGGCMVPPVFMPDFMTSLARVTPHGWALQGYQDVMVRGANIAATLPTVAALMGFAAVFFLLGVTRFRFD